MHLLFMFLKHFFNVLALEFTLRSIQMLMLLIIIKYIYVCDPLSENSAKVIFF